MIPSIYRLIGLSIMLLLLTSCTNMPKQPPPQTKYACSQDLHSGDAISILEASLKESEFLAVHRGDDALRWLLTIADNAQQTLDVQYYIWKNDASGALLVDHLLDAADRGVKVRVLLDDFHLAGRDEGGILFNSHPNIELKVFNPLSVRSSRWAFRGLELLFNLPRLNHRMHNKLFVADREIGLLGGRNIGDEYFGISDHLSFRDLDLVARGPIAEDISSSFDSYWHSTWSYRIDGLDTTRVNPEELKNARRKLKARIAQAVALNNEFQLSKAGWKNRPAKQAEHFIKGHARVVYDCPPSDDTGRPTQVAQVLGELAASTEDDLFIISPYLVPKESLRSGLRTLIDRGVSIKILTNSLESSDSAAAVSGYARHRPELLHMGVDLYEMRGKPDNPDLFETPSADTDFISLHAKTIIFDHDSLYVGSLNLDPRSLELNTEIGLLIHSPELSEQIRSTFELELKPESSWHVLLNEEGQARWHSSIGVRNSTPARNLWQRFSTFIYSLLPIEDQL